MESKVLVGWCTLTSLRGVRGRMQCVDVKSEEPSQCRIRVFKVCLIPTHSLFMWVWLSMTCSFFSFRPGETFCSFRCNRPLKFPVRPEERWGRQKSLWALLFLDWVTEKIYQKSRTFLTRHHALSKLRIHRCFCFNYLGPRRKGELRSQMESAVIANVARFCPCPLPKTLVPPGGFQREGTSGTRGSQRSTKNEDGSSSGMTDDRVFYCFSGRGPHISMDRLWKITVVAACNSDWCHGPFWYSTGGLQRQDVRPLSGLNSGPGNPNTRQIDKTWKKL